jgi:nicotinamide-nucleotide amidase
MKEIIIERAKIVFQAASLKKNVLASAESCTGGMLSTAITDIPGSSTVFECGFVTYSNLSKMRILGVREETLKTFGAVSEEVAAEMAIGALYNSKANLAISITGVAGPGGTTAKPEGMVCFSIAFDNKAKLNETKNFGPLGRNIVRQKATLYGLTLLENALAQ